MQCNVGQLNIAWNLEKNIEVTVVHICIIYIYISNDPIQCKFRKFHELKSMWMFTTNEKDEAEYIVGSLRIRVAQWRASVTACRIHARQKHRLLLCLTNHSTFSVAVGSF